MGIDDDSAMREKVSGRGKFLKTVCTLILEKSD